MCGDEERGTLQGERGARILYHGAGILYCQPRMSASGDNYSGYRIQMYTAEVQEFNPGSGRDSSPNLVAVDGKVRLAKSSSIDAHHRVG